MQKCLISPTYVLFLDIHLISSRQFTRTRKQAARRYYLDLRSDSQSLHERKMSKQVWGSFTWNIKTSATISLITLPLFAFLNWSARSFACFSASVCRFSFVNETCICSARAFSSLRAADNSSIVSRSLSVV